MSKIVKLPTTAQFFSSLIKIPCLLQIQQPPMEMSLFRRPAAADAQNQEFSAAMMSAAAPSGNLR